MMFSKIASVVLLICFIISIIFSIMFTFDGDIPEATLHLCNAILMYLVGRDYRE